MSSNYNIYLINREVSVAIRFLTAAFGFDLEENLLKRCQQLLQSTGSLELGKNQVHLRDRVRTSRQDLQTEWSENNHLAGMDRSSVPGLLVSPERLNSKGGAPLAQLGSQERILFGYAEPLIIYYTSSH